MGLGRAAQARPGLVVILIGVLSGALYVALRLASRSIFLNGLHVDVDGVQAVGLPADRARLAVAAAVYCSAATLLFVLYLAIVELCRRRHVGSRRSQALVLGFPVVFDVGLLFDRPYLSIDTLSYLAFGYVGATAGQNPYTQPAWEIAHTPFGQQLVALGWHAVNVTTYGPFWTGLSMAVVGLTGAVQPALLLQKALLVGASLGSAALIWAILGQVQPRLRLLGTAMYLWNPVILVELAGEGHNDAWMILFVLASLAATVQGRLGSALLASVLGILTKYLPLVFIPAELVYFWRVDTERSRLKLPFVIGTAVAIGLGLLTFSHFWAGPATFAGVLRIAGALSPNLDRLGRAAIFGVCLVVATLRVRDTPSLLRASAEIALAYALVGSLGYFPWYAGLPVALMVLTPDTTFRWLVLIISACAVAAAPFAAATNNDLVSPTLHTWSTRLARGVPILAYLLLAAAAHRPVASRRAGAQRLRRALLVVGQRGQGRGQVEPNS